MFKKFSLIPLFVALALVVLNWASTTTISHVNTNYTSMLPNNQVVSGRPLTEEEHFGAPSLALMDSSGKQVCGLTAITTYAAISVAHCFFLPNGFYHVIANSANITLDNLSENAQVVSIAHIEIHPNYKWSMYAQPYDIAVVFFNQPLQNIQPALIASSEYFKQLPEKNPVLKLEGVGDTIVHQPWETSAKALPNTFQQIFLPLIPSEKCLSYYPNLFVGNFCAGFEQGGKGTCQGDSGSGLYEEVIINSTNNNYSYRVLLGAVSYGRGCALTHSPTVFTNLSHYRTFIEDHVPEALWYNGETQN